MNLPPIILVSTESADKCMLLSTNRVDTRRLWKFDVIEYPERLVIGGTWDYDIPLLEPSLIEHLRDSGGKRRPKIVGGKIGNTGRVIRFPDGSCFCEYAFSNPNNTLPEQYLKVATGLDNEQKWHFPIGYAPVLIPPEPEESVGNTVIHETKIPVHIFRSFVESAIQKREECPISKDCFTKENVALTPCGHLFTYDALCSAIQYNSKCPTCRNPLSEANIQRW